MAKERKDRCFFHSMYSGYTIPSEEPTGRKDEKGNDEFITRMITFNNHTFRTNDPADIVIMEQKMLKNPEIVEIDPDRQQDAIGMIKSGEAKPSGVAKLLKIKW